MPSHELGSTAARTPLYSPQRAQERLRALYDRWRDDPTMENAAEVVDCAVLVKNPLLAIGPARAILDGNAMPAAKAVAKFVIDGPTTIDPELGSPEGTRIEISAQIRELKRRAADEPRNALVWLEKARLHTLIGDIESGKLSIRRAFGCAPESRLVLRALARFMVHIDTPEEGHEILRRSERMKVDPWLQAAEIALADAAETDPVSMRRAKGILQESSFEPTAPATCSG